MLTPLLKLHIATCLSGHTYACFVGFAGFPHYFASVVALEIGSAACGAHSIWPRQFTAAALVVAVTSPT